jgi:hypothetical protein
MSGGRRIKNDSNDLFFCETELWNRSIKKEGGGWIQWLLKFHNTDRVPETGTRSGTD